MISAKTKLCGIFGWPVEHSLSPDMHNAAFKELGLDMVYLAFNIAPEDLATGIKALRALNIAGVNITVPHKEKVIGLLDDLSPEARNIGAVNTIVNVHGRLIGDNTDGRGFIRSLAEESKETLAGKKILLLGAGGAARAIGVSLLGQRVKSVFLYDVVQEKTLGLASDLAKIATSTKVEKIEREQIGQVLKDADILINATPVGMKEHDPCVVEPELLTKKLFIYDIVYNRQTALLKEAAHRKIKHANGLGMLINQGAIAFELWTGKKAPVAVMRQAINK